MNVHCGKSKDLKKPLSFIPTHCSKIQEKNLRKLRIPHRTIFNRIKFKHKNIAKIRRFLFYALHNRSGGVKLYSATFENPKNRANGTRSIIEMQVAKRHGFESRAQYYAAKAYASQMGKGGKYADLKEVIFIAILDYELFPKKPHYKSNHTIRDDLTNERDLDGLRFVFIELPRFNKKLDGLSNIIEKWCFFFKYAPETTSKELAQLVKDEPIIEKAYDALDSYAWSEQDLLRYEQETKNEMDAEAILMQREIDGEKAGIAKGEKIGIEKNKIETAKKMKQAGIAPELIKKITGINAEE